MKAALRIGQKLPDYLWYLTTQVETWQDDEACDKADVMLFTPAEYSQQKQKQVDKIQI